MRTPRGNIPDKITLICREPYDVPLPVQLASEPGETLSVVEIFVSDATNAKTLETGRHWAKSYSHRGTAAQDPLTLTRDNSPMSGVRIIRLEHRGRGGRAYKVTLPGGNFYVDLREDVLLEALLSCGVTAGGLLAGEYVFARVASEMKLVRVGSALHASLAPRSNMPKPRPLASTSLVPGHAYKTLSGNVCVYVGRVDAEDIVYDVRYRVVSYADQSGLVAVGVMYRDVEAWLNYAERDYGGARSRVDSRFEDEVDAKFIADQMIKRGHYNFSLLKHRDVHEDLGPCPKMPSDTASITAEIRAAADAEYSANRGPGPMSNYGHGYGRTTRGLIKAYEFYAARSVRPVGTSQRTNLLREIISDPPLTWVSTAATKIRVDEGANRWTNEHGSTTMRDTST